MLLRSSYFVAALAALAAAKPIKKRVSKLQFFGVNESGPEFGQQNIPGTYNKDYVWPTLSTIDQFIANGMNIFRINILMERVIPNSLTGSLDAAYFGNLTQTVNYITGKGAYAMICPHNYGRYYNNIITDTAGFETFWKTLAKPFASNSKVMFDTNNEYHDMDQTLVVNLNQAAINGIRSVGATSQWITPEGNAWTGAWTWNQYNAATMGNLTDPSNKLIYQMHQYLDSDGSGTSDQCVSSTVGVERVQDATTWLRNNKKVGILGEFAAGANSQCETAIEGMLAHLDANSDVWKGAMWWAAGPWWGTYIYSIEPSSGPAWTTYMPILTQYE